MPEKVKITVYLDAADAEYLRQLASDDVRTLPKYCEAQLIKFIRSHRAANNHPPVYHTPQPASKPAIFQPQRPLTEEEKQNLF